MVTLSLGSRLREERLRLGLNQTDLAALASASKGAQINWEKDVNSPPASALKAYAAAGADVLYILTGRRMIEQPDFDELSHKEDLALVRQELLNVIGYPRPGESSEKAVERLLAEQVQTLRDIIESVGQNDDPDQIDEARNLLEIATDARKLAAYRAADHVQLREKRARLRELMDMWLETYRSRPSETAMNAMVAICLDYGVPISTLMELMHQLMVDGYQHATENALGKPPT